MRTVEELLEQARQLPPKERRRLIAELEALISDHVEAPGEAQPKTVAWLGDVHRDGWDGAFRLHECVDQQGQAPRRHLRGQAVKRVFVDSGGFFANLVPEDASLKKLSAVTQL
jgi:hypothetical protein